MESNLIGIYAFGSEMRCPICGKTFLRAGTDWVYKRPTNRGNIYFCSWSCMRRDEKKHPRRKCIGNENYGG